MAFTPDAKCESLRKSANIAWIGMEPPSDTAGMLGLGPTTTGWIIGSSASPSIAGTIMAICGPLLSSAELYNCHTGTTFISWPVAP